MQLPNEESHAEFTMHLQQCECTILKICLLFSHHDNDAAHDLYQEIVYQLWISYPRFHKDRSFEAWARRIAFNTAAKQWRKLKRSPKFEIISPRIALIDNEKDEMLKMLYDAIDLLNDKDRKLLFLYLDKMPLKKIASQFSTTETAIKHRIHKIKTELTKLVDKE